MDRLASPPFIVEMAFNPQGGIVSIDPAQTVLSLAGQEYRPTRMIMPSDFSPLTSFGGYNYQGLNLCYMSHNFRWEEKLQPLQSIQIPAGEKACIWLSFDLAPPPPETEYSVSIGGVEIAGKPIQIHSIRFIKGIAYYNDSIP